MQVYKTKWFAKWARKEGLNDQVLHAAVEEMNNGLVDADLGGHVYKKRAGLPGQGKRGGVRTLLAFKVEDKAFFLYGFAKSQKDNIGDKELRALKLLAANLLSYSDKALHKMLQAGEISEVTDNE